MLNTKGGMVIDGIFASETPDSSGEIISIKGCDISDLNNGTGCLNYEHKSGDGPNSTPLDIIGTILSAKKIFKREDCENERELLYWNKVSVPFIYGQARLYDGAGHPGALAAAAIIRDHAANGEKILLRYSIEGSTIDRDGPNLLKTVARRVAATIKPCNRSCDSGIISDPQAQNSVKNVEELADKLLNKPEKEETKKFEGFHPGYQKLGGSLEIEYVQMEKGDVLDASSIFREKKKKNMQERAEMEARQIDTSDVESHPFINIIQPSTDENKRIIFKRYDYTHMLPENAQKEGLKFYIDKYNPEGQHANRVYGRVFFNQEKVGERLSSYETMGHAIKSPQKSWAFTDKHNITPIIDAMTQKHAIFMAKKLNKATEAGMATGAPSTLTQGAALQREDIHGYKKKLKSKLQEAFLKKVFEENGLGGMLDLFKAEGDDEEEEADEDEDNAPLSDAEKQRIANATVRIIRRDATGKELKKPLIVDSDSYKNLKPMSVAARAAPKGGFSAPKGVFFDSETGVLHTPKASFPMYIPTDKEYHHILRDPTINAAHDEAMKNWTRLHELLHKGQISPEVLMYATIFSGLSPNNPVPMQEYAFSHVVDMFKEGLLNIKDLKDLYDPVLASGTKEQKEELNQKIRNSPQYKEFQRRVRAFGYHSPPAEGENVLSEHMRGFFAGPAGASTRYVQQIGKPQATAADKRYVPQTGIYQKALFGPFGKFLSIAGYPYLKETLEKLVAKYPKDGNKVARALLGLKHADSPGKRESLRTNVPEFEGIDTAVEDPHQTRVTGLAPKTVRYLLGMIGYGDMLVPDTHLTRHLFDLDRDRVTMAKIAVGMQKIANDPTAHKEDRKVAHQFLKDRGIKTAAQEEADRLAEQAAKAAGKKFKPKKLKKEKSKGVYDLFLPHAHVRDVMWNEPAHDEMVKLDDYYRKNHPAITFTAEKVFKDPTAVQHATFPGFWLHWLTINPHEAARKGTTFKGVHNAGTHHVPYFALVDKLHEKLGLEPLTSQYDIPYDPEKHKEQLATELEAKTGSRTPITAPPQPPKEKKPKAPKKDKKMLKSEDVDHDAKLLAKLFTANSIVQSELGEGYGKLYYLQHVVPHLIDMGDMNKSEESSSKEESSKSKSHEESEQSWGGKPHNDGLPDVADKFIDTFEDLTDEISVPNLKGKMKKAESFFNQLMTFNEINKSDSEEHPVDPDFEGVKMVPHTVKGINYGDVNSMSFWTPNKEGHPVYVKPYSASEAATYDLAKYLGVGDHVPKVQHVNDNGVQKMLIKGVPNMVHPNMLSVNKTESMHKMQDPETIQKMAIMDAIAHNNDRRFGGYGFDPQGKMMLTDHTNNFDPSNYGEQTLMPSYLAHSDTALTKNNAAWLQSLNTKQMVDILKKHGIINDLAHEKDFIEHVEDIKSNARPNFDIKLLFKERL